MTGSLWWDMAIGVAAAVMLAWVALAISLAVLRPRGGLLQEALGIMPDALRLIRRLAADPTLPRGVRIRLALLLVYLAIPLDLIPDFIPILGYADDAIVVTAVLRSVVQRAGLEAVRTHWPGTNDGFTALSRLTGLATQTPAVEYENRIPQVIRRGTTVRLSADGMRATWTRSRRPCFREVAYDKDVGSEAARVMGKVVKPWRR